MKGAAESHCELTEQNTEQVKTGRILSNTTHWPIEGSNNEVFTKNTVIDFKMLLTSCLYLYAALLCVYLCYRVHFMCAYTMLIKVILFILR